MIAEEQIAEDQIAEATAEDVEVISFAVAEDVVVAASSSNN